MTTKNWMEVLYCNKISFEYEAISDTVKVNGFEFTGTLVPNRNMFVDEILRKTMTGSDNEIIERLSYYTNKEVHFG